MVKAKYTKEQITNISFALFVDAYIERFILALQKSLGAKMPSKEQA
jgi:hypothetical protein